MRIIDEHLIATKDRSAFQFEFRIEFSNGITTDSIVIESRAQEVIEEIIADIRKSVMPLVPYN